MNLTVTGQNPFDRILNTKRLLLRRLGQTDAHDMFEYTSNPEVTKFLSWYPHDNLLQTKNYIDLILSQYSQSDCYTWAVELLALKKFIGIVRLFDVSIYNKRGELSYILNPGFQGNGFAREAISAVIEFCFKEAGLNRIQAKCASENFSSERLMQNLGMSYEGILRQFWMQKGILTDAKIYSILALENMKA